MYIAKAFAQQAQFLAAVAQAAKALPILNVTPSLGTDWNGESAVFFQIVLVDGTPRSQLLNLTKQISLAIVQRVQPLEEWGVLPYFDFRTQSLSRRESKNPPGHDPMSYADELLDLTQEIANLHPEQRYQSSLQRAVSTAYYALFHLLIYEATASWVRPELRSALARVFDHDPMKQAADKKVAELKSYFGGQPVEGRERTVGYHLYNAADVFAQAQ